MRKIVEQYSREAGVRKLEKALARVVRKSVVRILRDDKRPVVVGRDNVEDFLGKPLYEKEELERGVGIVTGLAWTPLGGATLPVEATLVHHKQAGLKLTGQLGNVMQESANIAYSYVRGNAEGFGAPEAFFDDAFLHLHVPAGATPKDGPSAGVTMATALLSRATGRKPRVGFAMTGELTLSGRVYPVGGIREKLLAAKRQKIKQVILPAANERDYVEVPDHIRRGIKVHFVETFEDVVGLIF